MSCKAVEQEGEEGEEEVEDEEEEEEEEVAPLSAFSWKPPSLHSTPLHFTPLLSASLESLSRANPKA